MKKKETAKPFTVDCYSEKLNSFSIFLMYLCANIVFQNAVNLKKHHFLYFFKLTVI